MEVDFRRHSSRMYCSNRLERIIISCFITLAITGIGGGYPCFVSCVVCIGGMTSLIGDVASHLGCTVGLKDSVTALAFVSLGTSLPGSSFLLTIRDPKIQCPCYTDLFASKVSAVQNKHADASISNVTGSNAVNVFLGVGVAWLLAAIHHSYHGTVFRVDSGT